MTPEMVGLRVCAIRKKRGLTQLDLARLLGFNDRQTISAIETGKRSLSATELIAIAEELDESLEKFTDPFLLVSEGKFSWRQRGVGNADLNFFEEQASYWLGAYRYLGKEIGVIWPLTRRALVLTRRSNFEDAKNAGERFSSEFELGEFPATKLEDVVRDELGILVLDVDIYPGISAGVGRLPEFDAVFLSRQRALGNRNLDVAHELFHLLTWEAMPPSRVEYMASSSRTKVGKLADSFAGALLMPKVSVEKNGNWNRIANDQLVSRLNQVADEMCVSSSALLWRLVDLGFCNKSDAAAIPKTKLTSNGLATATEQLRNLYSFEFVNVIATAIDRGIVSISRVCRTMGLTIDDLEVVFDSYGIECDVDI